MYIHISAPISLNCLQQKLDSKEQVRAMRNLPEMGAFKVHFSVFSEFDSLLLHNH